MKPIDVRFTDHGLFVEGLLVEHTDYGKVQPTPPDPEIEWPTDYIHPAFVYRSEFKVTLDDGEVASCLAEIDASLLELSKDPVVLRAQETAAHLEALGQFIRKRRGCDSH